MRISNASVRPGALVPSHSRLTSAPSLHAHTHSLAVAVAVAVDARTGMPKGTFEHRRFRIGQQALVRDQWVPTVKSEFGTACCVLRLWVGVAWEMWDGRSCGGGIGWGSTDSTPFRKSLRFLKETDLLGSGRLGPVYAATYKGRVRHLPAHSIQRKLIGLGYCEWYLGIRRLLRTWR